MKAGRRALRVGLQGAARVARTLAGLCLAQSCRC